MNMLVTGGLGFIGSNLVDRLGFEGHSVTVVDNLSSESSSKSYINKKAKYILEDIRNLNNISFNSKFDVIFHLAALARIQPSFDRPLEYVDVNINGTAVVSKLASDHNSKLIYSSSSSINNGVHETPYTFSKWAGEEVIKNWIQCFNVDAMFCRFYNVYGPREPEKGEYATVVRKFIRKHLNGEPLTVVGTGEQKRDFTHVEDIVDGILAIKGKGKPGELYHLGAGKSVSINELANMFPAAEKVFTPPRKGEALLTLAPYEETYKKLLWAANKDLKSYIEKTLGAENAINK